MTEEELFKIPFKFHSHTSMKNEYTTTYMSEDGRLGRCDHVPIHPRTRKYMKGYSHYWIDGKIYKTWEKFIEALKEWSPNPKIKES